MCVVTAVDLKLTSGRDLLGLVVKSGLRDGILKWAPANCGCSLLWYDATLSSGLSTPFLIPVLLPITLFFNSGPVFFSLLI